MIRIVPLAPNRIWRTYTGGKTLDNLQKLPNPTDTHFSEDWIASLTRATNPGREHFDKEGLSEVLIENEKVKLKHLIERDPVNFLGKQHYEKYGLSTGFLLKFLDSAIRLHLQCHPTIEFAKQYLNSNHGKTEGYYILGTREEVEEPYIYLGFQHPPSLSNLKEAIERQDIAFLEACFEKIPVKKGDAFYVPGGLPHAIGEGVFMVEIMEPTDLVARIEFEKAGYTLPEKARFMGKGIDFALSMFNLSALSVDAIKSRYFINPSLHFANNAVREWKIFDESITRYFRLNRLEVAGDYSFCKETFFIVIVINGSGSITAGEEIFEAAIGDKFFIPAATDKLTVNSTKGIELILAQPPQ